MSTMLVVSVVINAPVAVAWESYTQPQHITQWNFAIPEWHCPKADNNLQVGGSFSYRMEARDGSFGFDLEGTYQQVLPFERIMATMSDGRHVESMFEALEDGSTKFTQCFEPEDQNPFDLQQAGWQSIADNYKRHTESL